MGPLLPFVAHNPVCLSKCIFLITVSAQSAVAVNLLVFLCDMLLHCLLFEKIRLVNCQVIF
jgi:hypothetical protein